MRLLSLLMLLVATISHADPCTCISANTRDDPRLVEDLEQTYALTVTPDYVPDPRVCSLSGDPRYWQFLRELSAALGGIGAGGAPNIRIIVVDEPGRLQRRYYDEDFDAICRFCSNHPFVYEAGLDSGSKVGIFVRQQLRPHQLRLEQLRNEFRSRVGEDFQVRSTGAGRLSDGEFFAAIETNVKTMLRELQQLPVAQLQSSRAERGRLRLLPTVTVDAFGAAGDLRPMGQVGSTLRRLYPNGALR